MIPLEAPSILHRLGVGGIHGRLVGTSKLPPKSIRSHHANLAQWLNAVRSPMDTVELLENPPSGSDLQMWDG